MDILGIIEIAKYIAIAIGCIGLVVIYKGKRSRNKGLIHRGILVVIISVVLLICGYIIIKSTEKKVGSYIMKEYNR